MLNRLSVSQALVVAIVFVSRRLQIARHLCARMLPTIASLAKDRSRMNRRARRELRIRMDEGAWAGGKYLPAVHDSRAGKYRSRGMRCQYSSFQYISNTTAGAFCREASAFCLLTNITIFAILSTKPNGF